MITATHGSALLSGVREILRNAEVSQFGDRPGLPHLPEVETWLTDGEVFLKVAVAPEERPGASATPGHVQDALRSHGFILASVADSAADPSPAAALGSGRAVRIVCGP